MSIFGGIGNALSSFNPIMNTLQNVQSLVQGIQSGNLGQILSSASQLAMTYATGGAGALFSQAANIMSTINQASQLTSAVTNPGADTLANALTGAMGVEAGIGAIAMIGQQLGLPQQTIDAAQAAFAREQGDWGAVRENSREAGFGNHMNRGERASADFALDTIRNGGTQQQASFADTVAALIAGPNAGALQLGAALGMVGGFQGAMNNFAFALMGMLTENARTSTQASGDGQANAQAGGGNGGAPSAANAPANGTVDLPASSTASGNQSSGVASEGGGSILMKIAVALGRAMDDKMEKMAEKSDAIGDLSDSEQSKYGELTGELTALGQELKMLTEALNNTLKSIGEAGSSLARKQ